jgi:TRAP-type C4-dicarboxylate transport system permease small subunit
VRRALDALYLASGYLGAIFLVGTLAMVALGIAGRFFGFYVRGTDAYAGYCTAAAGFLALAHTLRRGEHIRVTLLLDRLPGRLSRRGLQLAAHLIGAFFAGIFAFFSARLVWQSHAFNDISTANDATPLWIPQLAMAAGALLLFVAIVDSLLMTLAGRDPVQRPAGSGPAHSE